MSAVVPDDAIAPVSLAPWSSRGYQLALDGALGLLGFFLLWSSAGTSIGLFVLLVLYCAAPARAWRATPWRDPIVVLGLALLAYIALRTFLGEGWSRGTAGWVNHYHELLMVPLLCGAMRLSARPDVFLRGLVVGAVCFAAMYWAVFLLGPSSLKVYNFFHLRRISAGFGFAVVAYLLLERARLGEGDRRLNLVVAAFLVLTILFANDARTGHVVLLLLLACAAFRAAPKRLRLPAVLAMLVATLLLGSLSHGVRNRVTETWQDARQLAAPRDTPSSTAQRMELLSNGFRVAGDHWLVGTGWMGYRQAFESAAAPRAGAGGPPPQVLISDNPHNEFLMQLGAGGVPALLLFVGWLAAPVWRAGRAGPRDDPWLGAFAAVSLAFVVCTMLNSALLDFVEGHVYGAVLAWLLARTLPGPARPPNVA